MNTLNKIIFQRVIPCLGRIFVGKNKYCNVIYYHDIVNCQGDTFMRTNIDVFKGQMRFLANEGYQTVRFDDLNENNTIQFQKKRVLIAFDDGWRSNYSEIFYFMKELGLRYNVFLTIGEIGNNSEYLSWNQVREMHHSGLVGFGVHTYTHPDMSKLDSVDLSVEIDKANMIFGEELGSSPLDFCYPFGYYSESSNHIIESKGCYRRIYTSRMMYSFEENGTIIFGRNGINNDWPFRVFRNQVNGYYNCFSKLYNFIH